MAKPEKGEVYTVGGQSVFVLYNGNGQPTDTYIRYVYSGYGWFPEKVDPPKLKLEEPPWNTIKRRFT